MIFRLSFAILMLAAVIAGVLRAMAFSGEAEQYFVSTTGNDVTNNCTSPQSPCKTIQGTVDKIPLGAHAGINVAAGTYVGPVNVFYYRFIHISGPLDNTGNCSDNTAVTLQLDSPGNIVSGQDHAILGVACLTLKGTVAGINGIHCRQYTIVDYYAVRFTGIDGNHVFCGESSRASCITSVDVLDSTRIHAAADNLSSLSLGCAINFSAGVTVSYVIGASGKSVIRAQGATFPGSALAGGKKFSIFDSTLDCPPSIPGTGSDSGDNAILHGC